MNASSTLMQITANSKKSFTVKLRLESIAGVFLAGLTWLNPFMAQAVPRVPTEGFEVLERLPMRPGDTTARELADLRSKVEIASHVTPPDPEPAALLAQRYFDLAMARGDPRYVGYADAVVRPYANTHSASLLGVRGQLLQYRHLFDEALKEFDAALQADPQFASAHAWRGAIYLVQAKYRAADEECQALQRLARPALFGACKGLVLAYGGELDKGHAALQAALQISQDKGNRLWLLTRLGEVSAWRGQPARAEQYFRDALSLGLDDGYLLAAWTDFLLDHKRPAEVVKWLAPWEASDSLLLRLALAETQLKLASAQAHVQALDDRFAAAKLRGDTTHRAEEARFQLQLKNNAALAVTLAAANYQVQKEPRDARVLLEAAVAAHDPAAAQAARDWLQSSRFEDPYVRQLGAQR